MPKHEHHLNMWLITRAIQVRDVLSDIITRKDEDASSNSYGEAPVRNSKKEMKEKMKE